MRTVNIATTINDLLARVANLKTANQLKPVKFNREGEAHANHIAKQEADRNG